MDSKASQCLSIGALFPDRIAEAVDLATPQAKSRAISD
jgi:hypothetical protein